MSQEKELPNTEEAEANIQSEHVDETEQDEAVSVQDKTDSSNSDESTTESSTESTESSTESTESTESSTESTGSDNQLEAETDLQSLLDAANKKAEDNWDQLLRTKAEMENLRRRSRLDVENAHKFAMEKFVTQLIPVIDSLELGLTTVGKDDHELLEKLHEGTEMTLKMFQDVFNKFDIEVIDPLNETFNPEFHQAMVMQESADVEPNTVLMVMQKGYSLNERLVRPAMVSVSKAVISEASATPEKSEPTKKIDEKA